MPLLIGTDDGVFRAEDVPFDSDGVERVLDCGTAQTVRQSDELASTLVASADGLFGSTDGGRTWGDLELPCNDDDALISVLATETGTLYAGTNFPSLFRSLDGGGTWTEMRGFRDLPSRGDWQSPLSPSRARLRALESPPGFPNTIVVGVEVGGFHVSRDGGETWSDRRANGPDDFHAVLALDRDIYVAATGHYDLDLETIGAGHALGLGGLHRTKDAGRSWTRLDVTNEYTYTRALCLHGDRLLFSGATLPVPNWFRDGADAALFEATGLGRAYERVSYPGDPHEVVEAFATFEGDVLGGTAAYPPDGDDDVGGHVLRRTAQGEYERVGSVPAPIKSLALV